VSYVAIGFSPANAEIYTSIFGPPRGDISGSSGVFISVATMNLLMDAARGQGGGHAELLAREVKRLRGRINSPELHHFAAGAVLEAVHQRERYPSEHDAGKDGADWFWLVGFLAGKALRAVGDDDRDKALHHCISTAAALANWHAAIMGVQADMRPGIEPPVSDAAHER
jgi:hypothetical protein